MKAKADIVGQGIITKKMIILAGLPYSQDILECVVGQDYTVLLSGSRSG